MPDANADQPDHAGVTIHPPLFYAAALVISYVINRFYALPIAQPGFGISRWCGLLLLLLCLGIVGTGRRLMKKHGTNINPTRPTTTIIQSGPYRFSRNPLYVALTLGYCGIALLLNTWWAYILLPLVLLPMHYLVVRREEDYLERKFGQSYQDYRSRVRRYL